jgi:hypothetical protein
MRSDGTEIREGRQLDRTPYGAEVGVPEVPCPIRGAEPDSHHHPTCPGGPGQLHERPARSRNGGVPVGAVHVSNGRGREVPVLRRPVRIL